MNSESRIKVAEAVAAVVDARLNSGTGYLRIPEFVTPFPVQELLDEFKRRDVIARVAIFGVPEPEVVPVGLSVTTDVHTAIEWRDDPQSDLPLVIIGDLERNRAAGLATVRSIRVSDVRNQLFASTLHQVRQEAMPASLERLLHQLQYDTRADLLECADYCHAVESGGVHKADIARSDLWRVGLLPDVKSADVDRSRLSDNAVLVSDLRSSDAATVQRLMVNLTPAQYQAVRAYASKPANVKLKELDYGDIRAAFRSVKRPAKRTVKTAETQTPSLLTLTQDKSYSEAAFLEQLSPADGSTPDSFEDQSVRLAGSTVAWEPAPVDQFAEWLSPSGLEHYADVAGATVNLDAVALHADEDDQTHTTWVSLAKALEILTTLERRVPDGESIGAAAACRTLIEYRRELIPYLAHIPHEGVRLFAASPTLFKTADALMSTWVELWTCLAELHRRLDPADREYAGEVGNLLAGSDMRVEVSGERVAAHLLPLHPIVLEPRVAAARVLRESPNDLDDDFVDLLASAADPGMPGITVAVGDTKRALSYAGTFKHLPVFEVAPRHAEGTELARTIQQIIDRFQNVHPYTKFSLSIALVGASPRLAKSVIKWLGSGSGERVRVDLFTRTRDLESMQETVDSTLEELTSTELDAERFALVIHEGADIATLPRRLRENRIQPHLVVAFNLAEVSPGKFTSNLAVPLQGSVITQWAFNVNPITSRPVIRPMSGSGRLVKAAELQQELTGLGPPAQERSPLLGQKVTESLAAVGEMATWVALCEEGSALATPLKMGNLRLLGRSVSGGHVAYVYSSNTRMLLEPVLRYLQQSTWIHPKKSELADFLHNTVRMALPEGLLGFFKTKGSLSNESVLGRLGLAAVLAYLRQDSDGDQLIVSLDTDAARQWLNLREGRDRRADLLSFNWTDDGVAVSVIEVKSRTEAVSWNGSEPESVTEALDQVKEMRLLLDKIFGVEPDDALTPSRREVLKRQVFLEALQQWDSIRESDKTEYERRVKSLNDLFDNPSAVTIQNKVFVVSTNQTGDPGERLASDGATSVVILGVPWLKRALESQAGGVVEIASDLLDEFDDFLPEAFDNELPPPPLSSPAPIQVESVGEGLTAREHTERLIPDDSPYAPSSHDVIEPSPAVAADDLDLDEVAVRVREALVARGAPLRVVDTDHATVGPSVIQIPFKLAQGARLSTLQSQEGDIARDLGVLAVRLSNWVGGAGYACIELPRPERQISDVKTVKMPPAPGGEITIALGASLDFTPYRVSLSDLPHLLVAGTTGSGKSVFMRSVLWQLTHLYGSEDLDLVIIDAKGMADYIDFRKAPHIKSGEDFHMGVAGALQLFADIVENRLPERVRIFNEYAHEAMERSTPVQITNVPSLIADAAARGVDPPLRPLVVLVDEFAELVMATADRKRFESLVTRFNQLARAIGGHLIAATQRPSTDVVSGVMKSNFARLALRVQSGVDSRVILDEAGAEALLGKGDLLFRSPIDGLVRLQGYNAPGPYRFKGRV